MKAKKVNQLLKLVVTFQLLINSFTPANSFATSLQDEEDSVDDGTNTELMKNQGQSQDQSKESSEGVSKGKVNIPQITLQSGQKYPLDGLFGAQFTIGSPSIAEVKNSESGPVLVAKSAGRTTLKAKIDDKEIEIQILVSGTSEKTNSFNSDFINELEKMPGLKIQKLNGKVLIQGEVLNRKAFQKILSYIHQYPKHLIFLANPAPGIKSSLIEQTRSLLSQKGFPEVQIENAGNRFFLEGRVATPIEVEQALEFAQTILPNIENHIAIPIQVEPTITIRLSILELSKSAHNELGLSWPNSVQEILSVGARIKSFSPLWSAQLKHLSKNGQAKVLAEPIIVLKNGSEAQLSAGGEIPIRLLSRFENKVVWKHYGLKFHIKVSGIAGKKIRTKVSSESSQLDDATSVDGIPGIRTTRLSTEIDATEGEPVVLTGLFQSSASKDVDKVPLLGSIPILGELFKSRRFRDNESELLVVLFPKFGTQSTSLTAERKRGLDLDLQWRLLD